MVIRGSVLVILFYMAMPVVASPSLQMQLKRSHTELGQPFMLTMTGHDLSQRLDEIDTSPWERDFHVERIGIETGIQDIRTRRYPAQRLHLRVYPRAVGQFKMTDLKFAEARLKGQILSVGKAEIDGRPLTTHLAISTQTAWQRQQVIVTLGVVTPQSFAQLQPNEARDENIEVLALPAQRSTLVAAGSSEYLLRQSWAVIFHRPGKQHLTLPGVAYYHSGVSHHTFYLPEISIEVQSLPGYLPPNIPVGKVNVEYQLPTWWDVRSGVLHQLQIRLTGVGIHPDELPAVMRVFQSNPDTTYFPADSNRSMSLGPQGLLATVVHDIPYTYTGTGMFKPPRLEWRYFDPVMGKLVAQFAELPWRLNLAWFWLWSGILMCAWAVFLLVRRLKHGIRYLVRYYTLMRRFHFAVSQVSSTQDLRTTLNIFSEAKHWPLNMNLTVWGDVWESHYGQSQSVRVWLDRLSCANYRDGGIGDVIHLREELLRLCRPVVSIWK